LIIWAIRHYNLKGSPINYKTHVSCPKKSVISFFSKRANLLFGVCLFCNFVRNTIYVLEVKVLEPVVLARKHKSGKAPILILDCMISQVSCGL